jgi:citrate lyase beta subunit
MQPFFFIKYFIDGFDSYFEKITNSDSVFVFDLEDSIKSVLIDSETESLKNNFRKVLIDIFKLYPQVLDYSLAVRVNHPRDKEFLEDVNTLKEITTVNWDTIIIPKVEDVETLEYAKFCFHEAGIDYNRLGALIESETGLKNVRNIIHNRPSNLKVIVFGHADYNLDSGTFPFAHQNHPVYWSWVSQIIHEMNSEELIFINSPCLYLRNDRLFNYNLNRLNQYGVKRLGQLTLTLNQSLLCNQFTPCETVTNPIHFTQTDNPITLAKEIVERHENRNSGKSFSIDINDYLISPHEYTAARLLLKKNKLA